MEELVMMRIGSGQRTPEGFANQIDGKGGHKAEFFGLYSIKSKIIQMQHINAKN